MDFETVKIAPEKAQETILGQGNFSLKTTDDIARVLMASAPGIKAGVAMNDGGMKVTRTSGNDERLERRAAGICHKIGAGHLFVALIEGAFPVNVLNDLQNVNGVCNVYAATANPLEVVVVKTSQGKGIVAVVDGASPEKIEDSDAQGDRRELLKKIGYKLG